MNHCSIQTKDSQVTTCQQKWFDPIAYSDYNRIMHWQIIDLYKKRLKKMSVRTKSNFTLVTESQVAECDT